MEPEYIHAEVHTDDFLIECEFDATPWFEAASDRAIVDLAACGYQNDYAADDVVLSYPNDLKPSRMLDLFHYIEIVGDIGYEVSVDDDEALSWIYANRRHLIIVSH